MSAAIPDPVIGIRPATCTERASPVCVPRAQKNRERSLSRCLEGAECLVVLTLYAGLVARLLSHWDDASFVNLLLVPSEGLVILFMLVRRGTEEVSHRPRDWALAFGAFCCPLLVVPTADHALVAPVVAGPILLIGMLVQMYAKLVLGLSFGVVPAHRGLKLAGPYRFVRHPMYSGYLLSHLAFLTMNPTWWNAGVYAVLYGLQVPRLLAEERLLDTDSQYRAYRSIVRFRLVPGIF